MSPGPIQLDQATALTLTLMLGPNGSVGIQASGGDVLLVNGHRVNSSGYEALSDSFVHFLTKHELTSLMFPERVTEADSEAFIGALKDLPPDLEPSFWQQLAKEKGIEGIVFSDRRYAVSVRDVLQSVASDRSLSDDLDDATTAELVATDVLIENLPTIAKDLLIKGDSDMMRKVLHKLFGPYTSHESPERSKLVRGCRELMETLIHALQHQFAVLSIDYLILAFREEDDDRLLVEIANLLHEMTSGALQFGDYALASRIFSEMREPPAPFARRRRNIGSRLRCPESQNGPGDASASDERASVERHLSPP